MSEIESLTWRFDVNYSIKFVEDDFITCHKFNLQSRKGFNSLSSNFLRNSSTTQVKQYPDVDFISFEQPAKFE